MKHLNISKTFFLFALLTLLCINWKDCWARNYTQAEYLNIGVQNGLYSAGNAVWVCTQGGLVYNSNPNNPGFFFIYDVLFQPNGNGTPSSFVKSGNNRWIVGMTGHGIYYTDNPSNILTNWTFVNILSAGEITDLEVIGGSGATTKILAGTRQGLYRSADNGFSWALISPNTWNVKSIAVNGSNILVAAGGENIWYSNNFGDNWELRNSGLVGYFWSLTFSLDGSTLFAGTSEFSSLNQPARTYRSFDLGLNWGEVTPNTHPYGWIFGITHSNESGNIAACYDGSGVFITQDNGVIWDEENTSLGSFSVVALVATGSNRLYASTKGGVYYTDNLGDNNVTSLNWIHVDYTYRPVSIGLPPVLNSGTLVAAVKYSGFKVSEDNGTTWTGYNSGLDSLTVINLNLNTGGYLVSTGSGVYLSSNTGASWELTSLTDTSIVNFESSGNNIYAVSRNTGFYRSSNAGISWTSSNTGLTNLEMRDVIIHAGSLFVCGKGGIYRSTNGGVSWTNSGADSSAYSLASDNSMLYCAGNKLFFSSNTGSTWSSNLFRSPSCFLESQDVVTNLAAKNGKVYLASTSLDSGLFISGNQGASWSNSFTGWGSRRFTSVVINSDTIYLGDRYGGITSLALNSTSTLNLRCLIEGLYPGSGEEAVQDTVTVNVRNISSPYAIVESSKILLSATGTGVVNFSNVANITSYNIQISNRNSLETWSKPGGEIFTGGVLNYDFTTSFSQAYGNNLASKGSKYCIYSGDVNQDGLIDLSDILTTFSDAAVFATGYTVTDLDGNQIVDTSDILIAFNNSSKFVQVIRP